MASVASFAGGGANVRPAEWGDAGDIGRLLVQLGYPCSDEEAAQRIGDIVQDPRQHLLLAEVEGQACGLICLHTFYSLAHGAELARITALVIAPEYRRRGIGRQLLREVEMLSRQHGMHRIEVTSNPRRTAAHAFYRSSGYDDNSLRFVKMLGD